MRKFPTAGWSFLILAVLASFAHAVNPTGTTVRRVSVLASTNGTELEIATTEPVTPNVQMITGPDRLVIDFPNATPASTLHNLAVGRGEVTGVRVGLFSSAPPVTRVVVDLKMPQTYQIFPSHNSVIVKLGPPETAFEVVTELTPQPSAQRPRLLVSFQNGQLRVWAEKATLAEVLNEIHRQTGADIGIPSGAEQDQVVANYGPGPAEQVIAALLNGSRFNFVTVGAPDNPAKLGSVILMPRTGGVVPTAPAPWQQPPQPVTPPSPPSPPAQPVEADTPPPQ
jgi:hypothetical protein